VYRINVAAPFSSVPAFVATGAGGVTRLERDAGASPRVCRAGATALFWGGTSTVNGLCGDARASGAATNDVVDERRSSG